MGSATMKAILWTDYGPTAGRVSERSRGYVQPPFAALKVCKYKRGMSLIKKTERIPIK
jgi:hypothetical protein